MATVKKRINVTLSGALERVLGDIARRDKVPQATKAADLLRLTLEIEEDNMFDKAAGKRDSGAAEFVSHKEAWA
jgi:hypothetical protein